uniref:Uncharacterized protein n=1 Tax=Timema poppense TaxID=170557 RepID=A0A7R9D4G1_TIMPO|nr:unnamed protein product [Timema poppensis]
MGVLEYTPSKCKDIIVAVCVIHNLCVNRNIPLLDPPPPNVNLDAEFLPWPARSFDYNPIENPWSTIAFRLAKMKPKNGAELRLVVTTLWQHVTVEEYRRFIDCMPEHIKMGIKTKGELLIVLIAKMPDGNEKNANVAGPMRFCFVQQRKQVGTLGQPANTKDIHPMRPRQIHQGSPMKDIIIDTVDTEDELDEDGEFVDLASTETNYFHDTWLPCQIVDKNLREGLPLAEEAEVGLCWDRVRTVLDHDLGKSLLKRSKTTQSQHGLSTVL